MGSWARHSRAGLSAVALAPLLAAALALRPRLRHGLGERLGRIPPGAPGGLWVHAASVGEAKAAIRLIRSLEQAGHGVRASTSTLAGRAVFRRELIGTPSNLAPLDHPWCVASALARARPALSVLIETELWPGWIAAAHRRGMPVVVASGRLSDRSFPRYWKLRRWMAPTLRRIDAVGTRTETDAERFVALGVPADRVCVTGDLKLDPPTERPALAVDLIRALADVPVVIGGSTHAGEETALLDALAGAEKAGHGCVLVLAPRQIERAEELERLCHSRQRRAHRRSRLGGRHLASGEVLILDTLGELAALYATARVAFVGGTLAPVGGHNLVEPVHTGCPVLFGPRTENVRKVVEILEPGGAGRRVETPGELVRAIVDAFEDPDGWRLRGELGREMLESHRGSVERTRRMIEAVVSRRAGGDPGSRLLPAAAGERSGGGV